MSDNIDCKNTDVCLRKNADFERWLLSSAEHFEMTNGIRTLLAERLPVEDHFEDIYGIDTKSHALIKHLVFPAQSTFEFSGV